CASPGRRESTQGTHCCCAICRPADRKLNGSCKCSLRRAVRGLLARFPAVSPAHGAKGRWDGWKVVGLALLQGLTEFLPVSSSAHLILVPALTGWPDQGLAFDVALHFGSLFAVLLYFRRDLIGMTASWGRSAATRQLDDNARLAWGV